MAPALGVAGFSVGIGVSTARPISSAAVRLSSAPVLQDLVPEPLASRCPVPPLALQAPVFWRRDMETFLSRRREVCEKLEDEVRERAAAEERRRRLQLPIDQQLQLLSAGTDEEKEEVPPAQVPDVLDNAAATGSFVMTLLNTDSLTASKARTVLSAVAAAGAQVAILPECGDISNDTAAAIGSMQWQYRAMRRTCRVTGRGGAPAAEQHPGAAEGRPDVDDRTRIGGGVAMLMPRDAAVRQVTEGSVQNVMEYLVLDVRLPGAQSNCRIAGVYVRPEAMTQALPHLERLMMEWSCDIIAGDFNVRHISWDQGSSYTKIVKSQGDAFYELLVENNYIVGAPDFAPTCVRDTGQSTIDLVLVKRTHAAACLDVLPVPGVAPHRMVVAAVTLSAAAVVTTAYSMRTENVQWRRVVEDHRDVFRRRLSGLLLRHPPERALTLAKRVLPGGRLRRHTVQPDRLTPMSPAETEADAHALMKLVRRRPVAAPATMRAPDDTTASTARSQAQLFADVYKQRQAASSRLPVLQFEVPANAGAPVVSPAAIEAAIKELRKSASPDQHGTDPILLEEATQVPGFCASLAAELTEALRTGVVPRHHRQSVLVPVHKTGRSYSLIVSFRPVAITAWPCRVNEHVIRWMLLQQVGDKIPSSCHGFMQTHGTDFALSDVFQSISDALGSYYKASGGTSQHFLKPVVLLVDFTDAFSRITALSVDKALQLLGCDVFVRRWVYSFLTDREFRVRWRGELSEWVTAEVGAPQGSVLGPLLWVLVSVALVLGLQAEVRNAWRRTDHVGFTVLADDFTLWAAHHDRAVTIEILNNLGRIVERWAADLGIAISTKTTAMAFDRSTRAYQPDCPTASGWAKLKVGEIDVDIVTSSTSVRILGVDADRRFTFMPHAEKAVQRYYGALADIRVCMPLVRFEHLRVLFSAYALPLLLYGAHVFWKDASVEAQDLMRTALAHGCRLVSGCTATCNNMATILEAGFQPLDQLVLDAAHRRGEAILATGGQSARIIRTKAKSTHKAQRSRGTYDGVEGGLRGLLGIAPASRVQGRTQSTFRSKPVPKTAMECVTKCDSIAPLATTYPVSPSVAESVRWYSEPLLQPREMRLLSDARLAELDDVVQSVKATANERRLSAIATKYRLFTDGSAKQVEDEEDMVTSGWAAQLYVGDTMSHETSGGGNAIACSYPMEMEAIRRGLIMAAGAVVQGQTLAVVTDSLSSISALQRGPTRAKDSLALRSWQAIESALSAGWSAIEFHFIYSHVDTAQSEAVDKAAGDARAKQQSMSVWYKDKARVRSNVSYREICASPRMTSCARVQVFGVAKADWSSRDSKRLVPADRRLLSQVRSNSCSLVPGMLRETTDTCKWCRVAPMARADRSALKHVFECDHRALARARVMLDVSVDKAMRHPLETATYLRLYVQQPDKLSYGLLAREQVDELSALLPSDLPDIQPAAVGTAPGVTSVRRDAERNRVRREHAAWVSEEQAAATASPAVDVFWSQPAAVIVDADETALADGDGALPAAASVPPVSVPVPDAADNPGDGQRSVVGARLL